MHSDTVLVAGHRLRLLDLGMTIGAVGILFTFIASAVTNTRTLYAAEPLKGLRAQGDRTDRVKSAGTCPLQALEPRA